MDRLPHLVVYAKFLSGLSNSPKKLYPLNCFLKLTESLFTVAFEFNTQVVKQALN
jgi:hypothetical protein